jgi:coproporphyrinogen III oxidase-like Fe-S oxidoreductase
VQAQGHSVIENGLLTPQEQAPEYLLMGLRIKEGIDLNRHAKLGGTHIDVAKIEALENLGLVERSGTRLMATHRGRPILNAIIRELNG